MSLVSSPATIKNKSVNQLQIVVILVPLVHLWKNYETVSVSPNVTLGILNQQPQWILSHSTNDKVQSHRVEKLFGLI